VLDPIPFRWEQWTREALQGWTGSAILHGILLLILAFWYFSPHLAQPKRFDSILAGSPNGVLEADDLSGGLNTPLTMPFAPDLDGPILESPELSQLQAPEIEPELKFRKVKKASAPGGSSSDNPGAGDGDGFGLARFGEGGERIHGVEVKVGDPQFTLIWNTDADLDLHVIEPGGKEIFWMEPQGVLGGELDVDNTKGLGPENVYWLSQIGGPGGKKVKGPGPPGVYKWYVVYYGGFGGFAKPTHWQVRVKHAGKVTVHHGKFKALNERSKLYTLTVEPDSLEPAKTTKTTSK
jgi:hypothetical protein